MRYQVKVTAVGEVRDVDGNLVSSEPVESVMEVTDEELRAMGMDPDQLDKEQ